MSVPKVKCPSCGSEWAGPVVFCGECGAAITSASSPSTPPGERVARVPPVPTGPGGRAVAPTKPSVPNSHATTMGMPAVRGGAASVSDSKSTTTGMPAVRPPDASPPTVRGGVGPAAVTPEPGRGSKPSGRKSRKGVVVMPAAAAHADTDKLLDALDAGFDSFTREPEPAVPARPTVPITPSTVPELPAKPDAEPPPEPPPGELPPTVRLGQPPAATPAPGATSAPADDPSEPTITVEPPSDPLAGLVAPPASAGLAGSAPALDDAALRAQHDADMAEVQALFTEMAIPHARPLRDFMIEVSWGDPTREWLDIAAPAATALRRAADILEMPDLLAALAGFIAAIERCQAEASIQADLKEPLIAAYGKLIELMPAAFALDGERGRREPIIVRSLLLQVPGVQKVALDKIYAAGLVSLEMIYAAGPKELAETTGLALDVAARIHDRFQAYRREAAAVDPGRERAAERNELEALTAELGRAHAAHEKAAAGWGAEAAAARARARKERSDVLLRVNVLLARMGEVDRLRALEKAPFAQKIRDLEAFLDEAKRKASR